MNIQLFALLLSGTVVTQASRLPRKQTVNEDMIDIYSHYMVRLLTFIFDCYLYLEFCPILMVYFEEFDTLDS